MWNAGSFFSPIPPIFPQGTGFSCHRLNRASLPLGPFCETFEPIRHKKLPPHQGRHLPESRTTNHEISEMSNPGLAAVRLTHEYRN